MRPMRRPRPKQMTKFQDRFCLACLRHMGFGWLLAGLITAPVLRAQTNEELFREYQFNFNLPGARANAMGGAFIGVADDATSSFSNPAGLAFLNELAVTLEYRHRGLDARTGEIGGSFNTQFSQGAVDLDDAVFFSLNFRIGAWYFGLYQHDYLDEVQQRDFQSRSLSDGVERIESRSIRLGLQGRTRGIGVARRLGRFKLGATLNLLELEGQTRYERRGLVVGPIPRTFSYTSSITDADRNWGFSIGALYTLSDDWSWGVVWREHPKFHLLEDVFEEVNGQPELIDALAAPFVVPDVFGLGTRYKLRPELSLFFDWQKIFYGEIIENGFLIVESLTSETKENYTIKNINEFHLGLEWLIPNERSVWALRAGYFRNPLHAVSYRGNDPAIQARFAGTGLSDEDHFTFGAGWVYHNRIEIDFSVNTWEVGRELNLSFIWRKK